MGPYGISDQEKGGGRYLKKFALQHLVHNAIRGYSLLLHCPTESSGEEDDDD
jgi:hypothetical protein